MTANLDSGLHTLVIEGSQSRSPFPSGMLRLSVRDFVGEGVYVLGPGDGGFKPYSGGADEYWIESGELHIGEYDAGAMALRGSFSLIVVQFSFAWERIQISEGQVEIAVMGGRRPAE